MVGLDFIMEQLASRFDFWHFEGGVAGVQNYIAWFITAFVLHLIASHWLTKTKGIFSKHLYLNQVVFFVVSYLLLV